MYRFKRLLVGLKLDPNYDKYTIQYAAKITRMAKSEKIYFLHVAKTLDFPEELEKEYPEINRPIDEVDQEKMEKMVMDNFKNGHPNTKIVYRVVEGNPLTELLKRTKQKLIDMIILGKDIEGTRLDIAEKVVRKAPCSVMIVPQGSRALIKRVLAPIDFSECSVNAVNKAIAFASTASLNPPIDFLHVYSVPWSYYSTGKSYDDFAKILKEHAEESYWKFISQFDLKEIKVTPIFKLSESIPKTIHQTIKEQGSDLLFLGVRGKRAAVTVLLGSTTEKLLQTTRIPLVIVKRKGAGIGLLEALFDLNRS
ncbi:MAG: hypothetical protein B6244_04805 [Candidatus Cloacimonetes bacterium 4572_55]|nr:MAG: hypothetical protein B6244_04805 [Candidatus Cloacimonetes bacterium 4572_55]